MTVAARTGYHWFPARGVLFRVRVCECVACAYQPSNCVFSVSLSVLRFQMILDNEHQLTKTSPLLASAAFAPGRTAGVGVVFPAGASVMAPDAQLLLRSPRVLMTSNSRLSTWLRDEGHHRP